MCSLETACPNPCPEVAHSGLFQPPRRMSAFRTKADSFSCSLTCPLERSPRRIPNGKMIQAGGTRRWRLTSLTFPRVQCDVMVMAARREERGLIAISLHQVEPQHAAIKFRCAIKV